WSAGDGRAVGAAVVGEAGEGVDGVHLAAPEVGGEPVSVGLGDGQVGGPFGEPVEHALRRVDGGHVVAPTDHGDGDAAVPAAEVHDLRVAGDDGGQHVGLCAPRLPVRLFGDAPQRVDRGRVGPVPGLNDGFGTHVVSSQSSTVCQEAVPASCQM